MAASPAARQRLRQSRKRWAEESEQRSKRMTAGEAISLFREEKAAWLERTAERRAELERQCRAAIARADAEAVSQRRGGRPKGSGKPKHGPGIWVPSRDPKDLLRASRPGGTL